ncbi:MAG TPA: sugar phosphate isomerase/epimerase [Gemmatimonadales bacterium]|nr:sugar phosphate isomerase/epimerase [Gemmatimonadales bacterium]
MTSRRDFIAGLGAGALSAGVPLGKLAHGLEPPLYPPMNLSRFATPVTPAPSDIKWGCAAITWGGNDMQAIEDIAALGFAGIQLRSNVLTQFGTRPAALRELLAQHHLTLAAFSSGAVPVEPTLEAETVASHTSHARFVHDVGGLYLQVTDERPRGRPVVAADYERLGRLLTAIGRASADLGVSLGYHNHVGALGEGPDAVDRILAAADPRYVKLLLDVAHYQQGGGDPVQAIRRYHDRLLLLHIKDLESPAPGSPYRFVELGRGKVDLAGVFAALEAVKFRGWAVVELDAVPDNARTPKESARISKQFLEGRLGVWQPSPRAAP